MKNKNLKKILVFITFFVALTLFMGAVSAASYTINDVKLASTGVKNYTETHDNVPGYVDVSSKNSTTPSFLYTLTKTTVQLNSGSTSPVTISNVSSAPSPSGSATGTLYKSEYVDVASNINSFISSNGRAPNYASTSLGNVRYESLVYTYAKIIDFYRDSDRLPNYVTVSSIAGVDSTGVVIDNVAPIVSNNLASGSYNTTKSVTLTATDHVDPNPKVYYSTNGGSTWNYQTKTVTLTLNPGVTTLKYYGRDAAGNTGSIQTATYTIDTTAPTVTVSPAGGVYNTTPTITLTASDNLDSSPVIYYTINGTNPTTSSIRYTSPITIVTTTILKFMAVDDAGNKAPVQTQNYTLTTMLNNTVLNRNTGQIYSHIQDAINDILTSNGNIIEITSGTYIEDIILDKILTLRPVSGSNVILRPAIQYSPTIRIISSGSGSTIQGLTIKGDNSASIQFDPANNCIIANNTITYSNGLYIYGSNNIITGNIVTNTFWGIDLSLSSNNTVTGNTITNNDYGISVSYEGNNTITGNTITNNVNRGISMLESSNNTVTGNTITNNEYGIYNYSSDERYSNNNINFNSITGNDYGLYMTGNPNATVNATNNWWGSNNPTVSSGDPSDICIVGGNVTYTPWLSEDI